MRVAEVLLRNRYPLRYELAASESFLRNSCSTMLWYAMATPPHGLPSQPNGVVSCESSSCSRMSADCACSSAAGWSPSCDSTAHMFRCVSAAFSTFCSAASILSAFCKCVSAAWSFLAAVVACEIVQCDCSSGLVALSQNLSFLEGSSTTA